MLCYGELGVDNLIRVPHLPTPERAAFPSEDSYRVGGAAANTAIWLAGWGVPVRLAGNLVGQDELGSQLWDWLRAYPTLDLSFIERRVGLATPFCRILVTPDAERTILVFGYPQTPKTPLTAQMLEGVSFLALDLYGGEERLQAAQAARRAGVTTVILDLIEPDHPALAWTDILILSTTYLRSADSSSDPLQRAGLLQRACQGSVILTDGPRPVRVFSKDGLTLSLFPPRVEAVDTTGAGDVFRAGLIYGLLQGYDLVESVALATAAGALKVSQPSGSPVAPLKDVTRLAAELARAEA